MLALNFVFSKTKMFKLLFILFVIKQSLGNSMFGYRCLFSRAKYCPISGGNSDRNIAYLKRTNFCVFLCLRAKKNRISRVLISANDKFLKISTYQFKTLPSPPLPSPPPPQKKRKRLLNQVILIDFEKS